MAQRTRATLPAPSPRSSACQPDTAQKHLPSPTHDRHQGALPQQANFQGTAQYAAPEVLHNASAASPASDVFAAGRILWNWLTKIPAADDSILVPVCALVEQMVHENVQRRLDASGAVKALLKLEIDTLGQHIVPERRAA